MRKGVPATEKELYERVTAGLGRASDAYIKAFREANRQHGGNGDLEHLKPSCDTVFVKLASEYDFTSLAVQVATSKDPGPHPELCFNIDVFFDTLHRIPDAQRLSALVKMGLHVGGDGTGSRLSSLWNDVDLDFFSEEYWLLKGLMQGLEPAPESSPPPNELGEVNLGEVTMGEVTMGEVTLGEVTLGRGYIGRG